MTNRKIIDNYITMRYDRWLDYAQFQCERQGMPDEGVDVLNEVLENLLKKEEDFIMGLYNRQSKQYRELDFFILRMIAINTSSDTSPYRHRYHHKRFLKDDNIQLSRLDLIDEEYCERDRPAEIARDMRLVRWVFNGLQLTDFERSVFDWVFFQGEAQKDWPGPESIKSSVYPAYRNVRTAIGMVLYALGLSRICPDCMTNRANELATVFYRSRRVVLSRKS